MKKLVVVVSTFAILIVSLGIAISQMKGGMGKEVTVTGEWVDSACYIKMGAKGPDHKDCAIACAKAGIPTAILEDKTGNVYFITGDKEASSPLAKFDAGKIAMADRVTVKGGAKLLTVVSVEKAK